jgi:hypothetical protein
MFVKLIVDQLLVQNTHKAIPVVQNVLSNLAVRIPKLVHNRTHYILIQFYNTVTLANPVINFGLLLLCSTPAAVK